MAGSRQETMSTAPLVPPDRLLTRNTKGQGSRRKGTLGKGDSGLASCKWRGGHRELGRECPLPVSAAQRCVMPTGQCTLPVPAVPPSGQPADGRAPRESRSDP